MAEKERIILIDGSSYFFRAFYAIRQLSTSAGFPTNAIYGFINMLMRVLEVEKPPKLGIVFDTGKPTFRKELYKEYKANREVPPDDLVVQIPVIQRAVDCFQIFRIQKPGFEADDLIGTLAKHAKKDGYAVEIITADKDLMQLVNKKVTLYDTMKDKRVDEGGVVERFGVTPSQMVDFLALMGDSSDNVPGVKGIGEKTAAKLIAEFGSLDGIYKHLDKIKKEKQRENLKNEKDIAYLSQKLVTIDCDVKIDFSWGELDYNGPDLDKLQEFFEEFEFQRLMKRFGMAAAPSEVDKSDYVALTSEKELEKVVTALKKEKSLCVDTETTSLKIHDANVVGLSFSAVLGKAYYVPIAHEAQGHLLKGQIPDAKAKKILKPLLEDPKIEKIGQNLKYDIQILRRWGIELKGVAADTLLASYLLDPEQPHNLDALALRHLKHQNITYEEVAGKGKSQISFSEVAIEKATAYAAEDADVTFRINNKLLPQLKDEKLLDLYQKVEIPLVEVLADMEYRGVSIDDKSLKKMAKELESDLGTTEDTIFKLAGGAFNINSPKQLAAVLFDDLNLPRLRKTKTGYSTDERVLLQLAEKHDIVLYILKYRELAKLKSTYVEGLLSEIHPETKRIHTRFNQTVTATGRLSSSNPNLQNIPTGKGKYDIRSVFVGAKGTTLFSADYSQVELRILAHMSEDKELLRAFHHGEDIHSFTAKLIFGKGKVTEAHRKIAKTINFGVIYGQTPYGLSQQLKISPGEAKEFIDNYFKRYSGVKAFFESVIDEARANGYVKTLMGRRRFLREINSSNRMRREMAERTALNTPLQGSAADMIKVAMINVHHKFLKEKLKSRMILQVHDELVVEAIDSERKKVEKIVKEQMEGALKLSVPCVVDVGWGANWAEAK